VCTAAWSQGSDSGRHPDNEAIPRVLIVRVESGLFYFNVDYVLEQVRLHGSQVSALRLVVWDLSTSPHVDIAGARMLHELQRDLDARGAALRIVDARAAVRDLLRKQLKRGAGEINRRLSIDDAVTGSASESGEAPGIERPRA
jgi:MFS superfamily sulfate permease-like transporter